MKKLFLWGMFCMAGIGGATADTTVVPSLDQDGRKGDIARLVKEKAVSKFDEADLNHDGKLSRDELGTTMPYLNKNFDRLDADKDGFLNWEEFLGHNHWPKSP